MQQAATGSTVVVAALRSALEATADALAHADLDRLLDCEARLQTALDAVPAQALPAALREAARDDVEGSRAALVRCRRLGVSLGEFIAAGLSARGVDEYGPRGAAGSSRVHSLNLTV